MKKLRLSAAVLCVCICFGLTACAPSDGKAYGELEITQSEKIEYTSAVKSDVLSKLKTAAMKVYSGLGATGALPKRFETAASRLISACEKREIDTNTLYSLTDAVSQSTELFIKLANGEVPSNGMLSLFGDVSSMLGVDKTSRIFYDLSLIYCGFEEQKFLELYEYSESKPQHFLKNAELWRDYQAKMTEIGEENFARIVRLFVGGTAIFSESDSVSEFSDKIGGSEIAAYFNAEGRLLAQLTFERENAEFLINFFGEIGFSHLFSAVSKSGDAASFSVHSIDFIKIISKSLIGVTSSDAKLLREGNASAFLYRIASRLTDDEKITVESFFESQGDSENYISYFKTLKAEKKFFGFCENTELTDSSELWAAGDAEFLSVLKKYFRSVAPAAAFSVYEL